jgi:hypothetical protein
MGWPDGVSIGVMDSIPIVALFAKIALHLGFSGAYLYMPIWQFICFLMQPIAAGYFIRKLEVTDFVAKWISIGLISLSSFFIYRTFHISLESQFLILFALGISIKEQGFKRNWYLKSFGLLGFTLFVNSYIAIMVLGILVYFHSVTMLIEKRYSRIFFFIFAVLLLMFSTSSILGLTKYSTNFDRGGFHFYTANILSFFSNYPFHSQDGMGGQYEGYAFLGIPFILLFCYLFFSTFNSRGNSKEFKIESRLWFLIILMFLISLGSIWWFGNYTTFNYSRIENMDNPFINLLLTIRAPGRFIWISAYLLFGVCALMLQEKMVRWNFKISQVGKIFLVLLFLFCNTASYSNIVIDSKDSNQIRTPNLIADLVKNGINKDEPTIFYPSLKCDLSFTQVNVLSQASIATASLGSPISEALISRSKGPFVCEENLRSPNTSLSSQEYANVNIIFWNSTKISEQEFSAAAEMANVICKKIGDVRLCVRQAV